MTATRTMRNFGDLMSSFFLAGVPSADSASAAFAFSLTAGMVFSWSFGGQSFGMVWSAVGRSGCWDGESEVSTTISTRRLRVTDRGSRRGHQRFWSVNPTADSRARRDAVGDEVPHHRRGAGRGELHPLG